MFLRNDLTSHKKWFSINPQKPCKLVITAIPIAHVNVEQLRASCPSQLFIIPMELHGHRSNYPVLHVHGVKYFLTECISTFTLDRYL